MPRGLAIHCSYIHSKALVCIWLTDLSWKMAFIKTTWQIIELRPLKNEKQVIAVCVNIATDCNNKRQEPTNSSAGPAQSGSSFQHIHTFASMHHLCYSVIFFLISILQFQNHASVSRKDFILPSTASCVESNKIF